MVKWAVSRSEEALQWGNNGRKTDLTETERTGSEQVSQKVIGHHGST